MIEDRELAAWQKQWNSLAEPLPELERKLKNMNLRFVIENGLATLAFLGMLAFAVLLWRKQSVVGAGWSAGVCALAFVEACFRLVAQRGAWRAQSQSVTGFVELWRRRLSARVRMLRMIGYVIPLWLMVCAVLLPLNWKVIGPNVAMHPATYIGMLISIVILVPTLLFGFSWYKRRKLAELNAELRKIEQILAENREQEPERLNNMQATEQYETIAPWWHTMLMIGVIGALSAWSAHQGGLVHIDVAGISHRLSNYLTVLSIEWLLIFAIWVPMRQRGRTVASIVAGRWVTVGAFLRDLGLGIAFFPLVAIPVSALTNHFAGHAGNTASTEMLPKTWLELVAWVALSATAGFCEEFIFRGYFTKQFRAWTGSAKLAIVGQAVIFGLGHGYYNAGKMFAVMILGLALGLLAHWRKSLRPGMLGHGLTDALGGVLAFFRVR